MYAVANSGRAPVSNDMIHESKPPRQEIETFFEYAK